MVHRPGRLLDHAARDRDAHLAILDQRGKRRALHEIHGEPELSLVLPDVVNGHDARVGAQPGRRLRLAPESLE